MPTRSPDLLAQNLARRDLAEVVAFLDALLGCESFEALHGHILNFAGVMRFPFVLYAYQEQIYSSTALVHLVNLSNPRAWMAEYEREGYVEHDPVRKHLELRLQEPGHDGLLLWSETPRPKSALGGRIIERREQHGLKHGFSVYDNSTHRDALFLISFARSTKPVDRRAALLGQIVVPHLARCHKRLEFLARVIRLTPRELTVANWLGQRKTNWEIAEILHLAPGTVKYHMANIFRKLGTTGRLETIALLTAFRYLY